MRDVMLTRPIATVTRLLMVVMIVAPSLSGCGTMTSRSEAGALPAPPRSAPTRTVTRVRCPALKPYDRATLDRAANEIEAMPAGAVVPGLIADYSDTRREIRALCPTR